MRSKLRCKTELWPNRTAPVLEQVHSELQAVLGTPARVAEPPLGLRDKITRAIEQLESDHPRLTNLLSKSLDLLSDVGI